MTILSSSFIQRIKDLNPDIIVRPGLINDGNQFVFLFNKYYTRKTSIAYYKWQFFASISDSAVFMAFHNDNLIGYVGIKVQSLSNGLVSGFVIDLLVDEAYRKRGVLYLLNEMLLSFCNKNKISVLTSLPNAVGNAALKSLGWKSITKIDNLVLNTTSNGTYDYRKGLYYATEEVKSNLPNVFNFVYNEAWYQWRFADNPNYDYSVIRGSDKEFSVVKSFTTMQGKLIGDIVLFMTNPGMSVSEALFRNIIDYFCKLGVDEIVTWALPHTQLYEKLSNKGFRSEPQQRFFCVYALQEKAATLYDIRCWEIMPCDAEIF